MKVFWNVFGFLTRAECSWYGLTEYFLSDVVSCGTDSSYFPESLQHQRVSNQTFLKFKCLVWTYLNDCPSLNLHTEWWQPVRCTAHGSQIFDMVPNDISGLSCRAVDQECKPSWIAIKTGRTPHFVWVLAPLQAELEEAMSATEGNTALQLCVALSYSSRQDITKACTQIAELAASDKINPSDITSDTISQYLSTSVLPQNVRSRITQFFPNFFCLIRVCNCASLISHENQFDT